MREQKHFVGVKLNNAQHQNMQAMMKEWDINASTVLRQALDYYADQERILNRLNELEARLTGDIQSLAQRNTTATQFSKQGQTIAWSFFEEQKEQLTKDLNNQRHEARHANNRAAFYQQQAAKLKEQLDETCLPKEDEKPFLEKMAKLLKTKIM